MKTQVHTLDVDPAADNGVAVRVDNVPANDFGFGVVIYDLPLGKRIVAIDVAARDKCIVSLMRGDAEVVRVVGPNGKWHRDHPTDQIITGFTDSTRVRLVVKAPREVHELRVCVVWRPLKPGADAAAVVDISPVAQPKETPKKHPLQEILEAEGSYKCRVGSLHGGAQCLAVVIEQDDDIFGLAGAVIMALGNPDTGPSEHEEISLAFQSASEGQLSEDRVVYFPDVKFVR